MEAEVAQRQQRAEADTRTLQAERASTQALAAQVEEAQARVVAAQRAADEQAASAAARYVFAFMGWWLGAI